MSPLNTLYGKLGLMPHIVRYISPVLAFAGWFICLLSSQALSQTNYCAKSHEATFLEFSGNLDSGAPVYAGAIPETSHAGDSSSTTTFADLDAVAAYSTSGTIVDSLNQFHEIKIYFFHTSANDYQARLYGKSEDVDPPVSFAIGLPRQIGSNSNWEVTLLFDGSGARTNAPAGDQPDLVAVVPWNNGSSQDAEIGIRLETITMHGATANVIYSDGDGGATLTYTSVNFPASSISLDEHDILLKISEALNSDGGIISESSIPIVPADGVPQGSNPTTFDDLNNSSVSSSGAHLIDPSGQPKFVRLFYFHTGAGVITVKAYVDSADVLPDGESAGRPRLIATANLTFDNQGNRTNLPQADSADMQHVIHWKGGIASTRLFVIFAPVNFLYHTRWNCGHEMRYGSSCGGLAPGSDSDSDGVSDCRDNCPLDPAKSAPGLCGCGHSDIDQDNDGTADCSDACPADPLKTSPGICGCGASETDSDEDGTPDCIDQCQNDPSKIVPGQCGCGASDLDSDGDGTADCKDLCPNDTNKSTPGSCGCGVSDTDLNNNGSSDCLDPTQATSPTPPKVRLVQNLVLVNLQKFQGRVLYLVELQRGFVKRYYSQFLDQIEISNLSTGTWAVRYRVQVGDGHTKKVSKYSAIRRFKINEAQVSTRKK